MKREAQEMIFHRPERGIFIPSISVIAQTGYNVERELAQYFGIKSNRAEDPFHYRIKGPYSWGPSRLNSFTQETTETALQNWWRGFSVIWPVRTDEWIRRVLAKLVDDTQCETNPEAYFLFNRGDGTFECVAKTGQSNLTPR